MEILDIIKEAFIFPSQNLEKLAIYIVLTFIVGLLVAGGIISSFLGVNNSAIGVVLGAILLIAALVVSFIISGYQLGILKSGIDQTPEAPAIDWKNDLISGIKLLVVNIVYFIIPAIIVLIIGLITNLPGTIMDAAQQSAVAPANASAVANSTGMAVSSVSDATMAALGTSIAITALIAIVVFIIFAFLQTMGQSRLANTGSLGEALNIREAFNDLTNIGIGKVIAVVILIFVVIGVVNGILGILSSQVSQLSILSVVLTPYLAFFSQRAIGLLYSDVA
jgi:hypothetical protein